ncbi:MAG: FtsQ-type POTRA domain-containing protein [Bryobacteraceae bacterium]
MARKNPESVILQPTPRLTRRRLIVGFVAFVLVVGLSLYAFQLLEQFLIRDKRFAVSTPDGAPSQVIRISGASHASLRNIEAVFNEDFGRSLYLVPLEERLATLRAVDWVRDASIARVWPNRLVVNVTERAPVAFITLPPSRFALIDADGVILPPAQDKFNLPVLRGVKATSSLEDRRLAVQRMLRLTTDLGDAMKEIAEIDISQAENIAITQPHNGRIVKLLLGDRDYSERYQTFLNHVADIDARVPGAKVLDLRLDDRITVVEAEE